MPQYVINILCVVFAILGLTIWLVTLWINGYFGKKGMEKQATTQNPVEDIREIRKV